MFRRFRGIGEESWTFICGLLSCVQINIANCSGRCAWCRDFLDSASRCGQLPAAADPNEVGVWYDDTGKGRRKDRDLTATRSAAKSFGSKTRWPIKASRRSTNIIPSRRCARGQFAACRCSVISNRCPKAASTTAGFTIRRKASHTASLSISLNRNTLKVTGYKGMRFLGKSFIWTRAPVDLPSCAPDAASNAGTAG